MHRQDQQYFEAIITLTGYPEWEILVEELKKEIYQTQANVLENSTTWDQVCAAKGWAAGLAYLVNLRENNAKAYASVLEQAALDADI